MSGLLPTIITSRSSIHNFSRSRNDSEEDERKKRQQDTNGTWCVNIFVLIKAENTERENEAEEARKIDRTFYWRRKIRFLLLVRHQSGAYKLFYYVSDTSYFSSYDVCKADD